MSYDLNIKNYDEDELLGVLGTQEPATSMTELSIGKHIAAFKAKITQSMAPDSDGLRKVLEFADSARAKLLSYVERRQPVQLPPTNYNVLQSQNQVSRDSHSVITDKIIPPINVAEYAFPVGVINPLERRTFTKVINIDSMFRQNYSTTSSNRFQWTLPQTENKVVSIKIASVELPVMWYDISEKNQNNIFVVKLFSMQKYIDGIFTIHIPSGNYNNLEMIEMVNNIFETKRGGLEYLLLDIDGITTKTTLRVRSPPDNDTMISRGYSNVCPYEQLPSDEYSPEFHFELDFFIPPSGVEHGPDADVAFRKTLGWYLGFRKMNYKVTRRDNYTDTATTYQPIPYVYRGALRSESSFGAGKGHYIYIAVDDYNRNCLTETISSHTGDVFIGNNLLGRISVNVPAQDIMINNASDRVFKQRDYLGPVNLRKFNIELLNKFGDLLDLNNNDFSMALEMTVLY